jgi:transposase
MYKVNFSTMSYVCSECGSNHIAFVKQNYFICENCDTILESDLNRSFEIYKFTIEREKRNKNKKK